MSATIDQRVVEMRFDNQNFEKNVSTTMSTLDKFKQKLNLTGASKGLEDVNAAAKKVDMSGLGRGIETVSAKFSAMQVIGTTALVNLTNSAMAAGERMISALTIDPVKTGFQEYETQINAVQTILANTESKGSTIDDVNRALDELNTYADKTIYNFTEMTRNIGTFTAAGVDLDTSVSAIQGIANLAAVSGSTSQQASTAMYQLSQALASGTVKLMDWNSVVNAGMGGEVFQNALKETARIHGVAIDQMIEDEGSFRETLSKGWLTSEILTETLNNFTLAAEEGTEQWNEYKKSLMDKGYSEDQANAILKMANTATDAATKVKTFTQLWDVLKESAQSGWSQTWKIIIGDFEDAKETLSPLADVLTGFINKMSDARNAVIKSAFGKTFTGLLDNIKDFMKPIQNSADSIKEVVKSVKDYAAVVDEIIGGKWGNGQERWDKLTEAGYDWAHAQNLVNEKLGNAKRHATDYSEAQNEVAESQKKVTESTVDYIVELANMSEAELKAAGYTDEQIQAFKELKEAADKTGIPLKEFIENIDKIDGRYLLINSFKNAGQGLVAVFTSIGQAWRGIFHGDASDEEILTKRSEALFNVIAAMHKFSTKIQGVKDRSDELTRTFKGLFAIVDIVTTIFGGGLKVALKLASEILSYFHMDLLDVTANVGDAIVRFRDWFESIFDISKVLNKIVPGVKKAASALGDFVRKVKNSEAFGKFVSYLNKVAGGMRELFAGISDMDEFKSLMSVLGKAGEAIRKWIETLKNSNNIPGDIIAGLAKGLREGAPEIIEAVFDLAKAIITGICDVLGIHSPSTVFMAIGGFIIAGLVLGLKEGLVSVPESLQGIVDKCIAILQNIDWGTIFASGVSIAGIWFIKKIGDALENFSAPFAGIGDILENAADAVKSFGKVTKAVALNIKTKALKNLAVSIAILAGVVIALALLVDDPKKLWNAVGIVAALAAVLVGLAWATGKMSDASVDIGKHGVNIEGLKGSLLPIGIAMLALAGIVKLIGSMDTGKAIQGFVGVIALMGAMLGFLYICRKIVSNKALKNIDVIGKLMTKLSFAMLLMVGVAKLASKLEWGEMGKAAAFAAGFALFIGALNLVTKNSNKNINKIGGMMIKLSIAIGLMVGVIKLIDFLTLPEVFKGIAFAAGFALFVKMLVWATKVGKDQDLAKVTGLILSVSVSLTLLAGVCKLIDGLTVEEMAKGALFAAGFVLLVKGLMKVLTIGNDTQIAKVAGTILAMSVAIGVMAAVAMMLSLLDIKGLAKGVIAVGILGSVMALMIKMTQGANDIKDNLIVMTVAIGLMAAAVAGLSFIDPKKLAGAVLAMSVLMGMFSLMAYSTKHVGKAMGTLIVMTVAVALLAGILITLSLLDVQSSLINAAALSLLLVAVSASMLLLSKMNVNIGNALKGVLALTAMAIPMLAFVGVLAVMSHIQNATTNAMILTGLMTVMSLLLVPLTIIGYLWPGAAIGLVALTAMAIPMLAFVGVLALMNNVQNATANAELLISLMTIMTDILVKLAIVGPLALIGVAAMQGLTLVMVEVGLLAAAVGALVEKFPSLQTFLDTGLPILEQLAVGIGSMIGGFIGAVGESLGDSLVAIGEDISDFMESLKIASTHASDIDPTSFDGAKALIDVLGDIALTMLGTSIADFFILGGDSLDKFKEDGTKFFQALKAISDEMVGFQLPENFSADSVKTLLGALTAVSLTSMGTSLLDTFTSMVSDEGAMDKFKNDAIAFFKAIKAISAEMCGFTFPEDFSSEGLKTLLTALKDVALATTGISLADMFAQMAGDEGAMEKFKTDGVNFFRAMKAISAEMTGFTFTEEFDAEGLKALLTVLKDTASTMTGVAISDMFAQMVGDEGSMEKFKTDGIAFFQAVKAIAGEMTGFVLPEDFSQDSLNQLFSAMKSIGEHTRGASWSDIFTLGGTTMEKFQADGVAMFTALKAISSEAAGVTSESFSLAETAITKIKQIIEQLKGIDYSGVAEFTGIGTGGFGADGPMHDIGVAIKDFGTQVAGIDVAAVETATTAAAKIRSLITNLVGLDTSGIESFKTADVGSAIKSYNEKVKGIDVEVVASSINSAMKLKNFIVSLAGIDVSGVAAYKTAIDSLGTVSLDNFVKSFSTALPNLGAMGGNMIDALVNGIRSKQAALSTVMNSIITNLVTSINSKQVVLSTAGNNLVESLIRGMNSRHASATTLVNKLLADMLTMILSRIPAFGTAGQTLMAQFINGINKNGASIKTAFTTPISGALTSIGGYYSSFYSAGSSLVDGFAAGISANSYKAEAKAAAMASAAYEAARQELDINSPSKIFRSLGYSVPEGFAMGIDKLSGMASDSATSMADVAIDGVKNSISKIADAINGDLDTQPTITPVLDLSNIRAGANSIGSMLGFGTSVGLMTNVGAINAGMSSIQNGGNEDVVSALNKLREDISNLGGTTYQINGINYNNDSAVSDALETLVRYARMERRM